MNIYKITGEISLTLDSEPIQLYFCVNSNLVSVRNPRYLVPVKIFLKSLMKWFLQFYNYGKYDIMALSLTFINIIFYFVYLFRAALSRLL
jgi:hypothetical protein